MNNIDEEIKYTNYYVEKAKLEAGYTIALEKNEQKQYVLSKYKPREQSIALLGEELGNEQTVWILFGFNFGYFVDELIKRVGNQVRIIVIEPNEVLLKHQMELVENQDSNNNSNIILFSGNKFDILKQILDNHISGEDFNNFKIKGSDTYLKYYYGYFKQITQIIDEIVYSRISNFNTVSFFRIQWMKNIIRNRHKINDSYDISHHEGKYRNLPAVIVSAGPSLKKNIHQLKDFKGIIFAIGRTLTPLLELGIKPDFVVSVDPTDIIYETFGKDKSFNIPLITMCEGNSKVVEGSQGEIYFMHNSVELMGLLDIKVNPILSVSGSVATLCLSTASYMGCDPIVFIGQDLAYTNEEKHSSLSLMQRETNDNKIHHKEQLKYIKSYDGGEIASDASLISFLRWFEEFISKYRDCRYINATEGGAYIEGAEHISLQETINRYCQGVEKPIIEHKRLEREKTDINNNLKEALVQLKELKQFIQDIKEYHKQLMVITNKKRSSKLLQLINKKETKMLELKRGEIILKMMMEDIGYAIASSNASKRPIGETEEGLQQRKVRLNYEMYEHLLLESQKLIELIEGEMER